MVVYILLIMLWILLWNGCIRGKYPQKQFFLVTSIFLLFLLMGMRSIEIGPDTKSYCTKYRLYANVSWESIFNVNLELGEKNYGFYILNKIVAMIFPDYYVFYLLVISAIISFSLYRFIKEFSENYLMSLIMLLSLGFIFFFMSGVKQTLAIAFVLLALIELKKDKVLKYILLVIIAASFHNTALIVLILWPIFKLKIKKLYIIIIPILIFISTIFQSQIASLLQILVSDGKYSVYGTIYKSSNNLTGLFIQCSIIFVVFILTFYRFKEDKELQFFVPIYAVGLFFQSLTPVVAEFFRISMYFNIIGCVMLPYAIYHSRIKQKRLIFMLLTSIFLIYFFISNIGNMAMVPYRFFW